MDQETDQELSISRRRLPHWSFEGSAYFVTWCLHPHQGGLLPEERSLVAAVLNHFDKIRYDLFCYIIMNDHVHVLFHTSGSEVLPSILHTWKSYSANRLQRKYKRAGKVWQEESYDRIIRNEREFYDTARYILNNLYKRWGIEDYDWAWLKTVD